MEELIAESQKLLAETRVFLRKRKLLDQPELPPEKKSTPTLPLVGLRMVPNLSFRQAPTCWSPQSAFNVLRALNSGSLSQVPVQLIEKYKPEDVTEADFRQQAVVLYANRPLARNSAAADGLPLLRLNMPFQEDVPFGWTAIILDCSKKGIKTSQFRLRRVSWVEYSEFYHLSNDQQRRQLNWKMANRFNELLAKFTAAFNEPNPVLDDYIAHFEPVAVKERIEPNMHFHPEVKGKSLTGCDCGVQ